MTSRPFVPTITSAPDVPVIVAACPLQLGGAAEAVPAMSAEATAARATAARVAKTFIPSSFIEVSERLRYPTTEGENTSRCGGTRLRCCILAASREVGFRY